ncbi:MAG TPA: glycine betaine ABC transporter substrate-binding protein, partial [Gammaproteobacteria bacterium]|nr:glycine betaine ABC transporter substrate-binding protein [Gammaproteobacteria bacterium]
MIPRLGIVLALVAALTGCGGPQGPLKVGAKDFEEQLILAHMLAELARGEGMRAMVVECQDTYGCQQAMRDGRVDVMVEYSGTAAVLGGREAEPNAASPEALYRDLGLRWLGGLGIDNPYKMVVPTARAAALGLQSIGDLSRLDGGVRVATPSVYARRPGDGLLPLLRRYGLRLAEPPMLIDNPGERFDAVLSGRADVAVAYATDGALAGRRLRVLDDPLGFFPPYRAGVIASPDAVEGYPSLPKLVTALHGRLDTATMQGLNARVQLEGQTPAAVAGDFLRTAGLLRETAGRRREAELDVAVHRADRLATETGRALRAVRQAFPQRSVQLREVDEPLDELADGRARLAVLGSERFFRPAAEGMERDRRGEAVAVLGTRMLQLVRRPGSGAPLSGRIGILPAGSGGAEVSERVLALAGRQPAARGQPRELLRRLAAGGLDGVLLLADVPDPELAEALAGSDRLRLVPLAGTLGERRTVDLPYLKPTRIPADSYAGQKGPVETLGTQVVVAGPAPQAGGAARVGGPAAAL